MSEAKKNDAPSAEALDVAFQIVEVVGQWDLAKTRLRRLAADDVSLLVERAMDRVRREARAEAFEEGVEALEELRWSSTSNDLVDGAKALLALAAKERAK